MKRFYLFLVVAVLSFTSCHNDIWNSINDLDSRVKALEELCREMNTNISSLQSLIEVIQSGDYITNIVPITKGGEVIGYTITFKNHEPITIFNGEDGTTANIPVIGAAQDTDGIYYWTVNGEWLLDENGNKIRVTGNDGQPGSEGQTGPSGITPTLKIENGMWYVSYDNGSTWTMLGQATGDPGQPGQPGQNGQDGESIFANITYDANSVVFTLNDGTTITVPRGNGTGGTTTVPIIDGAIMAPFSVSATKQVYFSKGNLLYKTEGQHACNDGSTKPGTWAFATESYFYQKYNNDSISATYTGWIDLFEWGASGYNIIPYAANSKCTLNADISNTNYDWGVYNAISNGGNQPNMWRTLTAEEWDYVLFNRNGASRLRFRASIQGTRIDNGKNIGPVNGLVLLPDDWNNVNLRYTLESGFATNNLSPQMWEEFKKEGAIFLPLTGYKTSRSNTWDSGVSTPYSTTIYAVYYWSSKVNSSSDAYCTRIFNSTNTINKTYCLPIRLVKDVPASSNN